MTTGGVRRLSGLQLQVLSLYRRCLREARTADPGREKGFEEYIKREFREKTQIITPREINTIEHYIRKGERQLKLMSSPGIRGATHRHFKSS